MQTQVTQTNTTGAVCVLSHADLVRVLGFAVLVDAGIARDKPGTTIKAELAPAEADGEFTATVSVLIDHNYVPPQPEPQGGDGAGDASLKSDGAGQPGTPPVPSANGAASVGGPAIGGLQIPGTPTA